MDITVLLAQIIAVANDTGGDPRGSGEVGGMSLLLISFSSFQKETLFQVKESFIFPVSSLCLKEANQGL